MIVRVLNLFQLVAAVAVLVRLSAGAKRQASLSPSTHRDEIDCDVSVVIPARDEALRIGKCLDGLAGEPLAEILVVDDSSSDDTAAVATAHGGKVVTAPELPNGWVGKPWALDCGLRAATSEWVMFLDADTLPMPGLIAAAVERANSTGVHVLSLAARFRTTSNLQQALHASLLAGLIYRFGPIGTERTPSVFRTLLNGQCLLVKRQWLLSQGGFELSSKNMTDDIALGQGLAARGAKIGFYDGADVLQVQMYEGSTETWKEWGRSLPMADVLPLRTQLLDLATLWLTQTLPILRLTTGRSTWTDRFLLAMRVALIPAMLRVFDRPRVGMLLSPLLDPAAVFRLTLALVRPNNSWRGRTYAPTRTGIR